MSTKLKEYVVVHTRRIDVDGAYDDVLLIHKDKPAWQKGRLNLVGGKVEENESPLQCAVRELKEEAGLDPIPSQPVLHCGMIFGVDCIIHCIRVDVDPYDSQTLQPREGETEKVEWFTFKEAWADDRLMPNLKVIVPMLHLGVTGWKLVDQTSSSDIHGVIVQLPIMKPFTNG
jgi:8-oxo-dGTP pyrophosphatase MutT (NUDIX family)